MRTSPRHARSLDSYKREVVPLIDKIFLILPVTEPAPVDDASDVADIAPNSVSLYQNHRDPTDGLDAMDRCRERPKNRGQIS